MGLRCSLGVAVVAALGCGRIDFDPLSFGTGGDGGDGRDAPVDVGSTTCSAWGNVTRQTQFATFADDWELAFHPGGLALVYTSTTVDSNLFISTRASTSDPWGAPVALTDLNTTDLEGGPAWSPDGSRLYFYRINLNTSTTMELMATYHGGSSFTILGPSDLPDGFSWDLEVGELEVFYTTAPSNQDYDLHRATRPAIGMTWVEDTAFAAAINRTGMGMAEGWPSFDRAHQTLYFERSEGGLGQIATMQRDAPDQPFHPYVDVPELVGPNGENGDPDIAPDGLTLAFDSSRTGGAGVNDIYFATRTCQ
jgi:hypothetical protein